jgi:hypothetical protein
MGCATFKPLDLIPTREIEFRAATQINGGNLLPIDVIYIAYYEELREVTRYGPDQWFDSPRRQGWAAKETLSLQGGDVITIELDRKLLARAKMVVVFADFESVTDPAAQQVVIDYAGQKRETVLVEESRLAPSNEALKYMK